MKKCKICGNDKPLSDFYAHPNTADKKASYCKKCQSNKSNGKHNQESKFFVHQDLETI